MASLKRKAKGALKSKTMRANAAVVAGVALDVIANGGGVISAIGGPYAVLGMAVLNAVLRAVTSEPLEYKAD